MEEKSIKTLIKDFLKKFAEEPVAPQSSEVLLEDGSVLIADKVESGGIAMIGSDLANPGEYKAKDGLTIVVGENGTISEVKEGAPSEENVAATAGTEEVMMSEEAPLEEEKKEEEMGKPLEEEKEMSSCMCAQKEKEFSDMKERLDIMENAFFNFAKFNEETISKMQKEIKLFSENPSEYKPEEIKVESKKVRSYSIGINKDAFKK